MLSLPLPLHKPEKMLQPLPRKGLVVHLGLFSSSVRSRGSAAEGTLAAAGAARVGGRAGAAPLAQNGGRARPGRCCWTRCPGQGRWSRCFAAHTQRAARVPPDPRLRRCGARPCSPAALCARRRGPAMRSASCPWRRALATVAPALGLCSPTRVPAALSRTAQASQSPCRATLSPPLLPAALRYTLRTEGLPQGISRTSRRARAHLPRHGWGLAGPGELPAGWTCCRCFPRCSLAV